MKDYEYLIELKDEQKQTVKEKIELLEKVKGVEIFYDDGQERIKYTLDDATDEYGVFVNVCEIVQDAGGEIGFLGDKTITVQAEESSEGDTLQETQPQDECQSVQTVKQAKEKEKRKKRAFESDSYIRLAEIVVAFVVYLIFGLNKVVPACICIALVAYEIIYDAFCDLSKKKFTDNVAVSLTLVLLAFGANFNTAFITASVFSLIKIGNTELIKFVKRKNFPYISCEKLNVNGSNTDYKTVKAGDEVFLTKLASFKGELIDSQAVIVVDGQEKTVNKGEIIPFGAKIKGKGILVKSLESYSNSQLSSRVMLETRLLDKTKNAVTENKKIYIVSACIFIFTIIASIILPTVTDRFSFENFFFAFYRLSAINVICCPLCNFFNELSIQTYLYALLKKQIKIEKFDNLKKYKTIVYDEKVLAENGQLRNNAYGILRELKDLKVEKQICVSLKNSSTIESVCKELKLKTFYNEISEEKLNELLQNALFVTEQDGKTVVKYGEEVIFEVTSDLREIPNAVGLSRFNSVINGIVKIVSCIVFAVTAVVSFAIFFPVINAIVASLIVITLAGALNCLKLTKND